MQTSISPSAQATQSIHPIQTIYPILSIQTTRTVQTNIRNIILIMISNAIRGVINNTGRSIIRAVCAFVIATFFILPTTVFAANIPCPAVAPSSSSSNWTLFGTPSGNFSHAAVVAGGTGYCFYDLDNPTGFLISTFIVNTNTLKPPLWYRKGCNEINSLCCKESPSACQFPTQ